MKPILLGIGLIALALVFTSANASPVIFTTNTTIESTNRSYDGQGIVVSNAVLTVDGPHSFSNLRLANGATLTHTTDSNGVPTEGLNLGVSGNLEVETGASINANGRGYSLGQGAGLGAQAGFPPSGGGGGHGGYGGVSSTNAAGGVAFDSPFEPGSPGGCGGSGLGGFGGAGGGMIRLMIGSNFIVHGSVAANGLNATNSRSGGGGGGSIWLTTQTISGNGVLVANGGAGEPVHGGGGGGGRIAVEFNTNAFTGTITAFGGNGWQRGGAGSVFLKNIGTPGEMRFDNGGISGAATLMNFTNATDVVLQGRATALVSGTPTLRHLIVRSNSSLTTVATNNAILNLTATGDAVIENGASLLVTGKGFPANQGTGLGQITQSVGGGAGHGGYGGSGVTNTLMALGGNYYGSLASPVTFGSGGRSIGVFSGGNGGGAVLLAVSGNLRLDGQISADGTAGIGPAGGASGGSVWLTLGGFSGAGIISASGGSGGLPFGGGGAGGRIAITCDTNSFTGNLAARGGAGGMAGSAGTIYSKLNSANTADLVLNNGGLVGTNAVLDVNGTYNLAVSGGGALRVTASLSLGNFDVGSNSTFLIGPLTTGSAGLLLNVASNATIAAGGRISGEGSGAPGGTGAGAGLYSPAGSTGGGHGGYGGRGAGFTNTLSPGGNIYDVTAAPNLPGSGGGGALQPAGAGGAALHLNVTGNLVVDGQISVNGFSAATNNAGGGSGGSLWLSLNRLSGSGRLSADGGSGHLPYGGGGGGGRIAVTWTSNSFTGSYSAKGGNGFVVGGAGTIYLKANNVQAPDLILDNGGLVGTNTVLDVSAIGNLTIGSGASVTSSITSIAIASNLIIGANAIWRFGNLNLTVGKANIAAGGGLVADGVSSFGAGSGQYSPLGSSGGGHGGYGGRGAGITSGGNIYDSTSNPIQAGSPGGLYSVGGPGGSFGGGALRMTVSGPLIVNGRITTDGGASYTTNAGGGSGGSLWLTLNQLSGSGVISASGGSGFLPNGGGGGGGRIAIYYNSNSFVGDILARGGNGFVPGGAGTIYLRANNNQIQIPSLIVDNGGLSGTNTVLDVAQLLNLTLGPGASLTSSISSVSIISNLTISANAAWRARELNLTVGAATIAAGGSLTADSTSSSGPGSVPNGGAGHGGYGGRGAGTPFGGNVYDSISSPVLAGSPGVVGGLAPGGGALRFTVSGLLALNGRISANASGGVTNGIGGGSGGSVWLMLNQFSGAGTISADGGAGHSPNGGGGGGGRVALYFNTNSFVGSISAKGGNGFVGGGAGTIYVKANNSPLPNVIADNGGLIGTNTVIDLGTISNLTIAGGANVRPAITTLSLSSLNIATNSTLLASSPGGALTLNISGAAQVDPGGSISADGLGAASGTGISGGAGQTGSPGSGGGGHSGYGGRGLATSVGIPGAGGNAYDLLINPALPGSGGGGLNQSGGAGGGTLHLNVTGPMTLGGRISANGLGTSTNGGGGGAGGSVWLTLNELIGNGAITAEGGSGHLPNGGGGGGGRISGSYNWVLKGRDFTNGFTGTMSAKGGAGYVKGGAGTIYVRTNNSSIANAFVDNGGMRGTNTLVSGAGGYDLYIQGAAVATNLGTPRDLFVRTNSWVAQTGILTVSRNATFDAGGGIGLDGLGMSANGLGSMFSTPKGGGGHGGYGALNPLGGGYAYDLAAWPTLTGSAGGNGSANSAAPPFGGAGGGATQLTVGNTLTLHGEISAEGNDGDFNSGGGSGGSVLIQVTTLAGDGLITAAGGNGNGTAGGGGGGRIAIYFNTNLFTGLLSACGGAGGAFGGAGTVYLRDKTRAVSSLVLDNCGNPGASTPISSTIGLATNLTVTQRAVAEMQGAIPIFSNLVVAAGGMVTSSRNDTNLFVALLGNLTVTEGAGIVTDTRGFARDSGPGYGGSFNYQGAGGSYGGWGGGAASGAFGGMIYGSATKPVDRGSGGGSGSGYPAAGSEGGGAIRLVVAGTVELNGLISASGGTGWQDDAGGGSGGSIWIGTRKFTGDGTLAAIGGDGDFFGGGGGGGGRIAIYAPMNTFTGLVSVIGGDGADFGAAGTIFNSGSLSGFDVVGQTPTGVVSNVVSQIALEFTEPVNLASVSASDVRIYTPYGLLPGTNQIFSSPAPSTLLVSFNAQNVPGNYRVEIGPLIEGLLAPRMSQVYTGAFSITLPMISGTVTNLNGQPVAGVTLSPSGGLISVTTDVNGNYSLGVPPDWNGTVTPRLGTNAFVPGQLNYSGVAASAVGENYLMVATIAPVLNLGLTGSGLSLKWNGILGVLYQPESSTNLVDWLPYGPPLPGTNGLMQLLVPTSDDPMYFVRLRAAN